LKYEAQESSEVRGPFEKKCLSITVTFGSFESKAFTNYNCCWGPFESKIAYVCITVAVVPL